MTSVIILGAILLLMLGSKKKHQDSEPSTQTYTVAPNDTLSKIAASFGTTADVLATANPQYFGAGQSVDLIQPGWVLTIPLPAQAPTPLDTPGASPLPVTSANVAPPPGNADNGPGSTSDGGNEPDPRMAPLLPKGKRGRLSFR